MTFSKEYAIDFERSPGPGTLHLRHVESHGDDLDDLLSNAMISLETDHGNEGPDWSLGDLPDAVYSAIEQDFVEFIAECQNRRAEEQAERNAEATNLNDSNGWGRK